VLVGEPQVDRATARAAVGEKPDPPAVAVDQLGRGSIEVQLDRPVQLLERVVAAGPEQALLDVEREHLLAIAHHRLAAGLAQAVGKRARCHVDVEAGLAAQHEPRHQQHDQADDRHDDDQLDQGEATRSAGAGHDLTSW
jgi:hypothetical protein